MRRHPQARLVGVPVAYLTVIIAMMLGLAPIWCLTMVLTVPAAVRLCTQDRTELSPRVRSWLSALLFQVGVGYAIGHIVR